jgi:hypothetical protein
MRLMSKRIVSAALWFFSMWYVGAYVAFFLGIPSVVGLSLGIAAAVLFAGDPLRVVWPRSAEPGGPIDGAQASGANSLAEAA